MVIECSSCQARFKLADDKIKANGTKVRCTKCREVFTVFPENPPDITPPVIVSPPVIETEKDIKSDDFFTMDDKTPTMPEVHTSAVGVPPGSTDDWNQEAESSFFADDAGTSDLDAINFDNFDNFDSPVFSVPTETSTNFEFNDDSAFSFEDSSLEIGVEQSKSAVQIEDKPESTESDNYFEDDFSSSSPPVSTLEKLSQANTIANDNDFSFSEAESSSDFSWGESNSLTLEPAAPEIPQEKQTPPPDTDFDFGSFSFDQETEPEPVTTDKVQRNDSIDTLTESESSIELSRDTETVAAPVLIRPEEPLKSSPSARPSRPRPRSRQIKKGSSHLLIKVIMSILFILGLVFGIMNREQIQKEYKNLVSGFIENQIPAEASGQIVLTKLSGGYLSHSREGELFVIRGVAINEFKGLRSSVLVKGTIYGENGVAIQTQSAYCGNTLKDESLKKLDFNEIREGMNNELGDNLVNLNISAGKSVPFMIVFNKVSQNIKEFTVEVVDSKAGLK